MIRALRDPRWLGGLAVAVAFAVACVLLAQWQLDRRVQRAERNAAVLENFDSAPVPLDEVLPGLTGTGRGPGGGGGDAEPTPEQQWTPVLLSGRYDADATVLVRNRPQSDTNGYQVAVPFDTSLPGGRPLRVLLVRGWVPAGTGAAGPASLPEPPGGTVEVLARLRTGESPATRTAPAGQTYRLHLPTLLAGDVTALTSAYAVVASEGGQPPAGMAMLDRPDTDPGPHLAYGVQWYLFALAGLGIWGVLARRHGQEQDEAGDRGTSSTWVYDPGR